VEQVENFKFLGVHITNKLTWSKHTKTVMKRARQNLFPLRCLKTFWYGSSNPQKVLQLNHREHPDWYDNCSASDRKALQRVVRTTQYITGAKLPAIQDLYTRRYQRKALNIVKDSSHPSHRLFSLLPHGERYRSSKSRSKRLLMATQPICKWLPPPPPPPHHCHSYMHGHFDNSTYMYKLPQLSGSPAH
jgi:hypothetical protein